jgi:hypothetical protein
MIADSKLVDVVIPSPNHSGKRIYPLSRVSVHCVVGQTSAESLGYLFADPGFEASSNYGIGYDGKIGQYLPESYRSWCTSSYDNDNRAITIEVASDTFEPYKVTDAAYKALIKLLVDICRRNGKKKLLWFGDKNKSLSYSPKSDELVMTVHRWFANKSCPGEYLYNRHQMIAAEVTKQLEGAAPTSDPFSLKFYCVGKNYSAPAGQVKTVQRLLNWLKYYGNDGKALKVDGICGDNTEYAIKVYQGKHDLATTGVVDKKMWKMLTAGK